MKQIKKDQIGSTHYSKILKTNIKIENNPDKIPFYESAGILSVIEEKTEESEDENPFEHKEITRFRSRRKE